MASKEFSPLLNSDSQRQDIDSADEMLCNTSEVSESPLKPQILNSSDAFTFLEDIEAPSFLLSTFDSCIFNSSTANSTDNNKIPEEHLVSLNSTDENFRSRFLTNSMNENSIHQFENSTRLTTDVKQGANVISKNSDTSEDITTKSELSTVNNKSNIDHDTEHGSKTMCSFEKEVLQVIRGLEETTISSMGEQSECFLNLDQISDSILIASSSNEDSVIRPDTSITEASNVKDKTVEKVIISSDAAQKPVNNVTFDTAKETKDEPNTTIVISSEPINEQIPKIADARSPINSTFLLDRTQKVNRTFDLGTRSDPIPATDKPEVANETIVLSCATKTEEKNGPEVANETIVLSCATKTEEKNGPEEENVEDLNNGMFLLGGKETNLMDMEASALNSVLAKSISGSINICKSYSLQRKGKEASSNRKRSLISKERMLKDAIKTEGASLQKKLDINPFSTLNLFKGKLRGPTLNLKEQRKGPIKATYIPEQTHLDDSCDEIRKSRAVSSPCTESKKGSKSESETSGPPMPSFGSFSTIDSERPSTPDIIDTPEVFRRTTSMTMMTSTPSMKCEGSNVKMVMMKMPDFPTPIMPPSTKTQMRKISETLDLEDCDEKTLTADNPEEKGEQQSHKNEVTVVRNADPKQADVLTNIEEIQKAVDIKTEVVKKSNKTDKENRNPSKPRQSISGFPLKARGLTPSTISKVKPTLGAGRPSISKSSKVLKTISACNTVRASCKTRAKSEKKSPSLRNDLPIKEQSKRVISAPKVQPPQRKSTVFKPAPIINSQRRMSRTSVPITKPATTKCVFPKVTVPDVKVIDEKASERTRQSVGIKRKSVIPRPIFKAKANLS